MSHSQCSWQKPNVACFGSHNGVQALQGGGISEITPKLEVALPAQPSSAHLVMCFRAVMSSQPMRRGRPASGATLRGAIEAHRKTFHRTADVEA